MKFYKNWKCMKTLLTHMFMIGVVNEVIVYSVSALSVTDICEFTTGQQIYCNCDQQGVDEARQVTCFIIETNGLNRSSPVWHGFKLQKNITSLMFTTRFDKRLTFMPVTALRNVADSLQVLTINEMKLSFLDTNSVNNFSQLLKINLESNEIRGLSESVFSHLPALKILSLSSNSIEVLKTNTLINLPKLEEIFLDRNRLTTIEDNAFNDLKSVREIDLRLNEINAITSATFHGLIGLKRLDLSRNRLKAIPDNGFIGAPILRELDLSKNYIESLAMNAFHNMSHLMSIQLNENKITNLLPQTFTGSPNLVLIDLSVNQLNTIERELIAHLKHLHDEQFVIYLRDNRLECDCRLLWLSDSSLNFGQLFKRELRHIKCVFTKQTDEYKVGDDIKVVMFGKNESIRNECQFKTDAEVEDILEVDNENSYENSVEDNDNTNESHNSSEVVNKIDVKINDYSETKTQSIGLKTEMSSKAQEEEQLKSSTEMNEEINSEINSESVDKKEMNTNDLNVRQKAGKSQVEASHDRSAGTDGSLSCLSNNTKTLIPFIIVLYMVCKKQMNLI